MLSIFLHVSYEGGHHLSLVVRPCRVLPVSFLFGRRCDTALVSPKVRTSMSPFRLSQPGLLLSSVRAVLKERSPGLPTSSMRDVQRRPPGVVCRASPSRCPLGRNHRNTGDRDGRVLVIHQHRNLFVNDTLGALRLAWPGKAVTLGHCEVKSWLATHAR